MLARTASDTLSRLARGFPILALTGPRQSGKTTLARAIFSSKPYISESAPFRGLESTYAAFFSSA